MLPVDVRLTTASTTTITTAAAAAAALLTVSSLLQFLQVLLSCVRQKRCICLRATFYRLDAFDVTHQTVIVLMAFLSVFSMDMCKMELAAACSKS